MKTLEGSKTDKDNFFNIYAYKHRSLGAIVVVDIVVFLIYSLNAIVSLVLILKSNLDITIVEFFQCIFTVCAFG